jgi:hypothetical protein
VTVARLGLTLLLLLPVGITSQQLRRIHPSAVEVHHDLRIALDPRHANCGPRIR